MDSAETRGRARTFERIKNYSTDVPVDRTVAEIEKMLTKSAASKILKDYDSAGNIFGLSFVINTVHGQMPVRMPVRIEKVIEVFKIQVSKGLLEKRYWEGDWARAQAARVGWRILRDWLDAQLALINVEMSSVPEIFLPYVYSAKLDKTVFDAFESGQLDRMLGEGNDDEHTLDSDRRRQ